MNTPSAGVITASPPLPLSPRPPGRSNGLLRQASSTSTAVRAPRALQPVDDPVGWKRGIADQLFLSFADLRDIRRQQVVLAADLEAVSSEEEQRDVARLDRLVESEQGLAHGTARLVLGDNHREAEPAQCGADRTRVVDGGLQPWNVLIGVIADQQGNALLRASGRGETYRDAQREDREAQVCLRHGCSRRCSRQAHGALSPPVWPSCSAVERHYPSSHCGEFCGRMMCMLWIGGLDENFVIALFEHGPRANRSPARIKCGQAFSGSCSS